MKFFKKRIFLYLATTLTFTLLFNCSSDKFSSGLDEANLTEQDSTFLVDSDSNGVADSLEKYVEDCELSLEECLALAREEQEKLVEELTLESPLVSDSSGTYNHTLFLEIESPDSAIIRYTLDGSDPSNTSTPYTHPIRIDSTVTIRVQAFLPGFIASEIIEMEYIITLQEQLPPPGFSDTSGTYPGPVQLKLTSDSSQASIYYTLDGSAPTPESFIYADSITISKNLMVKAIAAAPGFQSSLADSVVITLSPPEPAASPAGGTFSDTLDVSLSSVIEGAEIRYTLDNTTPSDTSPVFKDPIVIKGNTTLQSRVYVDGWLPGEVLVSQYEIIIPGTVTSPQFSPIGGIYSGNQLVTLSSSTDSAEIRYTLDGSDPDTGSLLYVSPIPVTGSTVIHANATKSGMFASAVNSASYLIKAKSPVIKPDSGTYADSVKIIISVPGDSNATIRYTWDGNLPNTGSELYTSPFYIDRTQTIQAANFVEGWQHSDPVSSPYIITRTETVITPLFTPPGGTYNSPISVAITTSTPGASIFYTLDGSEPDSTSNFYIGPFIVSDTVTVKTKAYKTGMHGSQVISATYAINFLANPTLIFTPEAGTVSAGSLVQLSTNAPNGIIRYTTDGTTPHSSSTPYGAGITISTNLTLKAGVFIEGLLRGDIHIRNYTVIAANTITYIGPDGRSLVPSVSETISWEASPEFTRFTLEYRYDGGEWILITNSVTSHTFNWDVPDIQSTDVWIRVSDSSGTYFDLNEAALTIAPNQTNTFEQIFISSPDEIPTNRFKAFYFNDAVGTIPYWTEEVDRPFIDYAWSDFHGIESSVFTGYWIGNFTFNETAEYEIHMNGGPGDGRIIIDGEVLFNDRVGTILTHTFTAGTHKIEVEYFNNWHTTDLNFLIVPPIEYTSALELETLLAPYSSSEIWYVGVIEALDQSSGAVNTDTKLDLELASTTQPVVLVLSSSGNIDWQIDMSAAPNLSAVVLSSNYPVSTLSGLPQHVDVYYHKTVPLAYYLYPNCSSTCSENYFIVARDYVRDNFGLTLNGTSHAIRSDSMYVPDLVIDLPTMTAIEDSTQALIDSAGVK